MWFFNKDAWHMEYNCIDCGGEMSSHAKMYNMACPCCGIPAECTIVETSKRSYQIKKVKVPVIKRKWFGLGAAYETTKTVTKRFYRG